MTGLSLSLEFVGLRAAQGMEREPQFLTGSSKLDVQNSWRCCGKRKSCPS